MGSEDTAVILKNLNSTSQRESLYLCPIANTAKQYNFTEIVRYSKTEVIFIKFTLCIERQMATLSTRINYVRSVLKNSVL